MNPTYKQYINMRCQHRLNSASNHMTISIGQSEAAFSNSSNIYHTTLLTVCRERSSVDDLEINVCVCLENVSHNRIGLRNC
jgi:hypothetical protein